MTKPDEFAAFRKLPVAKRVVLCWYYLYRKEQELDKRENRKLNSLCDWEEYDIPDANSWEPQSHFNRKAVIVTISLLLFFLSSLWTFSKHMHFSGGKGSALLEERQQRLQAEADSLVLQSIQMDSLHSNTYVLKFFQKQARPNSYQVRIRSRREIARLTGNLPKDTDSMIVLLASTNAVLQSVSLNDTESSDKAETSLEHIDTLFMNAGL